MGTRAAAFTVKIRNLNDYQLRVLYGIMPIPTGVDIANTIKYFSQTLLTVLKDVPNYPYELLKNPDNDQTRLSLFPNLDYKGLYNALLPLLEVAPLIQNGLDAFGQAVLQCLGCLLPFLDGDLINHIPYLTASSIAVLPPSLHQHIVNYLCLYILPFTIPRHDWDNDNTVSNSLTSVVMMVFQYSTNPAHHCQLLECLMALKPDVLKDLLCVIAYGTSSARMSCAKLLFYYWPPFSSVLFDRKTLICKIANTLGNPTPFVCQRDLCPNSGNAEAAKVCFNHCISITYASDSPPPLYLCIECANEIHRDHPNQMFYDILHPIQQVSTACENKNCRAADKSPVSVCFSTECASYNGNHPIRYCQQCHGNRHNNRRGNDHMVHECISPTWSMDAETRTYMVEAIVSLLKEARATSVDSCKKDTSSIIEPKPSVVGPHQHLPNQQMMGNQHQQQQMLMNQQQQPANQQPIVPAHNSENITMEDRNLLGRFGVWLMVGRCVPDDNTPIETLGRLIAMLFHWFHVTAYSYDGNTYIHTYLHYATFPFLGSPFLLPGGDEGSIEKLKTEHVCDWLQRVKETHYQLLLSCLLPHPPEYARVGGHWDTLASRTSHLKDGLQRLFCLVPYEIITPEIWDHIMPHWMDAVVTDVPDKELHELKTVLSKILDSDISPLGFDPNKMYCFVANKFNQPSAHVQDQALRWLQALTVLEITMPLPLLFEMFGNGVQALKSGNGTAAEATTGGDDIASNGNRCNINIHNGDEDEDGDDDEDNDRPHVPVTPSNIERNLSCCILMLDTLLKQMELQEVDKHTGIGSNLCRDVCRLLKCMVTASWIGHGHPCTKSECTHCEYSVMWHQLALRLVKHMSPMHVAHPPDQPLVADDSAGEEAATTGCATTTAGSAMAAATAAAAAGVAAVANRKSPVDDAKKDASKPDVVINMPIPDMHSVGGVLVHMPHVCSIMTATVETVSEQLDLASILPSEKTMPAFAKAIALSEADVGTATAFASKPKIGQDGQTDADGESGDQPSQFRQASPGSFQLKIEELPQYLQYLYQLLNEIPKCENPDILYYMLQVVNVLCLNGDAFTKASREQREFFIWAQENVLIKSLWNLCNAEHSHICQATVPILLHCVTLPAGYDVFWKVIQESFHSIDWRVRFIAVERVTIIARFMDSTPLRTVVPLQAALANAFCYLISSIDDINVFVAQRATLNLGTVHDAAIKSLVFCLEMQFDTVIVDRPMVLQSLYQLHNSLCDRKILSWDFFLNRFDTLFLEAQIHLEKSGDIGCLRDLRNNDLNSEVFIRKIHRAQEALSHSNGSATSSVKTLSASFGTKWPYKRTMSAPASMVPRVDTKGQEKEKVYSRQYSAPILKRKSSRLGLDGHVHSFNTIDDANLLGFVHKIVDLEEGDKETMHLLVFLLMQFLSRADQAYPTETDKHMAKTQNIVLKHLYLLLGYNQAEKGLYIPAQRIRTSPVFSAYLSNLPQLLDQNHLMGLSLLNTSLVLLQYSPCPNAYINGNNDQYQFSHTPQSIRDDRYGIGGSYGLWSLEPHLRHSWLMSLVVLLYKYQYNQPPHCHSIQSLVRIVLNTLDSRYHRCKRMLTACLVPPAIVSQQATTVSISSTAAVAAAAAQAIAPTTRLREANITGPASVYIAATPPPLPAPLLTQVSSPAIIEPWNNSDLTATVVTPPSSSIVQSHTSAETSTSISRRRHKPRRALDDSHASDSDDLRCGRIRQKIPPADSFPEDDDDDEYEDLSTRQRRAIKTNENAQETDETESELIVIPESDMSDSTLYGSNHDSFDDHGVDDSNIEFLSRNPNELQTLPSSKNASYINLMESTANVSKITIDKRPTWFIGSEEESLQTKQNQLDSKGRKDEGDISCSKNEQSEKQTSSCTDSQQSDVPSDSGGAKSSSCVKHLSCQSSRKNKSGVATSVICPSASYSSDSSNGVVGDSSGSRDGRSRSASNSSSSTQQCENVMERSEREEHQLLPTPSVERLLPIGSQRSPVPKQSGKLSYENKLKYSDSQLAKNNLGQSDSLNDSYLSENNSSTHSPSFCRGSQLNIPSQERLLPVGAHSREINVIVEKVKHALGMTCQHESPPNSIEMKTSKTCSKYTSKDNRSEDYGSQRPLSPRRLTKQIALDSPPPHPIDSDENVPIYKHTYRSMNREKERSRSSASHRKHDGKCLNDEGGDRAGCSVGVWSASVTGGRIVSPAQVAGNATTPSIPVTISSHAVGWSTGEEDVRHSMSYRSSGGGGSDLRQSSFRTGNECVTDRCSECGATIEQYTDEEMGLAIIALGTFVHREPALAAPMLPDILSVVAAITDNARYSWQNEQNVHLPGGAVSVAHQFIRCVLHQLAPNGVFVQMFQTRAPLTARILFFRSVAHALVDFNELNPVAPLQLLIETLNSKKILAVDTLPTIVENMAAYLDCLPLESGPGTVTPLWNTLLSQLEILFRRIVFFLNNFDDLVPLLRIMISILKIPCINQFKGVLDPFSKVLSFAIQNQPLEYYYINELCHLCNRAFIRERDKMFLCRMVIYELLQALKFKSSLPDCNFLLLINLVLQDCGGSFLPSNVVFQVSLSSNEPTGSHGHHTTIHVTNAADCMRHHIGDIIEFLGDFHTISKIKSYRRGPTVLSAGAAGSTTITCGPQGISSSAAASGGSGTGSSQLQQSLPPPSGSSVVAAGSSGTSGTSSSVGSSQPSAQFALVVGLNDDTLGGMIKAGLAQYLALDITKSNGRDNRAVSKYFPWLCNTTSTGQPAGPREFVDCIGHVRLLSWLLLGSLTHTAIHHGSSHTAAAGVNTGGTGVGGAVSRCCGGGSGCVASQPIPQESSCQVADHIQLILAGFAEQPKASVLHMSSLFHVFILCQLWTIYLEQGQQQTAVAAAAAATTAAQQQQHAADSYVTLNVLFDFWGKITPCILQLISQSKTLSEMISLHFLCMLEALLECRSTFLSKLLPLWTPVLYSNHVQLPGHLQVRLQNCRNYPAATTSTSSLGGGTSRRRSASVGGPDQRRTNDSRDSAKFSTCDSLPHPIGNPILLRWLQRLQFKMGQIELQSSTAVQFYSL